MAATIRIQGVRYLPFRLALARFRKLRKNPTLTREGLHQHLRAGNIVSKRTGGVTYVNVESLEAYRDKRRGRPKKTQRASRPSTQAKAR